MSITITMTFCRESQFCNKEIKKKLFKETSLEFEGLHSIPNFLRVYKKLHTTTEASGCFSIIITLTFGLSK
jgi:hypothetical protein